MDAPSFVRDLWVSASQALGIGAFALFLYGAVVAIYRLYFGPLSKFPGPRLHAISHLPYLFQDKVQGTWTKSTTALHAQYGPIVRIAPDHLAVDGSIAWPEVYQRRAHEAEFGKSVESYQQGNEGILAADRESHRRQRRAMAHAFSATALKEQEEYIGSHLDVLLQRLREHAAKDEAFDITRWFNYLTFDIIGELAFGASFGCLESGDYHPFVAMVFYSIKASCTAVFLNSFGPLKPLLGLFIGGQEFQNREETQAMAQATLEKRMAQGPGTRRDFMTYILRNQGDGDKGMTRGELILNARTLIVAGSETTATALSGLMFHLTREPEAYRRLTAEIRSAFAAESDIDMRTTEALPYLQACLEETLRTNPPVSAMPPRISPGDEVAGQYIPKGILVSVYPWATHHNPQNFADPDKFVPERWLPADHRLHDPRYASDNKAAFKPFAAGMRDCIGKNLAYAEMRLITARLLWHFDMAAVEGQEDWISSQKVFVVAEKGPLNMKVKPVRPWGWHAR